MNNEQLITNCEVDHVAVITSSMTETTYLLESPANAEHLARSIEQYKAGQTMKKNLLLS